MYIVFIKTIYVVSKEETKNYIQRRLSLCGEHAVAFDIVEKPEVNRRGTWFSQRAPESSQYPARVYLVNLNRD